MTKNGELNQMSSHITPIEELPYKFAEALNAGQIDKFDNFIVADYINHNPYVPDGLEAVKNFFKGWIIAFPDTKVNVEDVFVDGQTAIARFTYHAHQQGEFMGIPATGNLITMRSIDIWRVKDGKFIEHWDELNLLEVMQQLGAIPAATLT